MDDPVSKNQFVDARAELGWQFSAEERLLLVVGRLN